MGLYIGLMSGTSLDGVDAVLADFATPEGAPPMVLAHAHLDMPGELRHTLMALNSSGADELHRAQLATSELMRLYARAALQVLHAGAVERQRVRAIGAHGQTVRHRPREFDGTGYTLQLMNGALLAELTGLDTVCDFRSRDVAAGGQGAPLTPAFHAAVFGRPGQTVAVLNIGGIANLSVLPATGAVLGFDCGPGNVLLDHWHALHRGAAFDAGGRWAASGHALPALLDALRDEPYFAATPPKSTGRDLFNAAWLQSRLDAFAPAAPAADVMATLTELTAVTAAEAVSTHAGHASALWVCGGGAFNDELLRRLRDHCRGLTVASTDARGVPPDQVEAMAFAWLARAFDLRRPGNLPSVTGAAGARLLGALYPA